MNLVKQEKVIVKFGLCRTEVRQMVLPGARGMLQHRDGKVIGHCVFILERHPIQAEW